MKKYILISAILLTSLSFGFEAAITPDNGSVTFEQAQNEATLINVDGMNKANQIEKAKKSIFAKRGKFEINEKQYNHQRALDYTTKHTNSLLPLY